MVGGRAWDCLTDTGKAPPGVVDRGDQFVGPGGQDGAALDGHAVGTRPAVSSSRDGEEVAVRHGEAHGGILAAQTGLPPLA